MKAQLTGNTYKKGLTRRATTEGMATLEILIAFAVLILCISAVIMVAFGNQSVAVDSQINSEAISKAQKMLEDARASSRGNWDKVVSFSQSDNFYTEDLEIGNVDDFIKSVSSKVSWQIDGRIHNVELSSMFTDWKNASTQGACADTAENTWANRSIAGLVNLGITGPATGVDVKDGIAYVTADGDGTAPDFFVIDVVSNPPQILHTLDTGPGLVGIRVSGDYAYVANTSSSNQLQVIDLNSLTKKIYKLPGSTNGNTSSIYYYNHKVYLGTATSAIAEFHIIDVGDISDIHEIGTFELGLKVNNIYVSNGYAFLATPDNNEELKILDVRNPAHIELLPGFDAPGSNGNGEGLARKNNKIFLGRALGNIELYVLDINNMENGALTSQNIDSSIKAMATMGNLVFLATTDTTKEFQVWKLSGGSSSFSFTSSLDLTGKATSIDCEGQTMYVTIEDPTNGLNIISSN